MTTRLLPKATLAALAAVGLFLPFGATLPGSCLRSIGVAGAAPSPSCSGDLRECLRAKADMHPGWNFGVRYVTAEDVADCMDAFRSCTSGGARQGGNAGSPPSTSQRNRSGNNADSMPKRFTIADGFDCTRSGTSVNCAAPTEESSSGSTTTKKISGNLSGLTMTGTRTEHFVGPSVNGCVSTVDYTWPLTYEFRSDGTGELTVSPGHYDQTLSGSCSGNFSEPVEGFGGAITWSPVN